MKGAIFINRTDHADRFVKIGNDLAQNYETLSATAFGWLVRILSRPPTWALNMESLICRHHGRHSIRTAMLELRAAGYVVACTRHEAGKFGAVEYHVFDQPQTAEQIQSLCARVGCRFNPPAASAAKMAGPRQPTVVGKTAVRKSDSGKSNTIKKEGEKDGGYKRIVSKETIPAADATGPIDDASGLNAGDLALLECQRQESAREGLEEPPPTPSAPPADLELVSEDEPDGQTFPWKQLMSAVKRIVPQVVMPTGAARRDHLMKQFWRKHGKTVGCFELLASKVAASDYLMARAGHTGNSGRPYSWGWIFSKNEKGELRAEVIMGGGYSTESMLWVLEKKAKEAAPKRKRVYLVGASNPTEIDPDELTAAGGKRYRICEETKAGLPVYLDRS